MYIYNFKKKQIQKVFGSMMHIPNDQFNQCLPPGWEEYYKACKLVPMSDYEAFISTLAQYIFDKENE